MPEVLIEGFVTIEVLVEKCVLAMPPQGDLPPATPQVQFKAPEDELAKEMTHDLEMIAPVLEVRLQAPLQAPPQATLQAVHLQAPLHEVQLQAPLQAGLEVWLQATL